MMRTQKLTDQFQHVIDLAAQLAEVVSADALMILLEGLTDWAQLRRAVGRRRVLLAADLALELEGAAEAGFPTVVLNMADSPVQEKLTQALLESVADDILAPGAPRGGDLQRLRGRHDRLDQHHSFRRTPGPPHFARPAAIRNQSAAGYAESGRRLGPRHRPRRPRGQARRHAVRRGRHAQSHRLAAIRWASIRCAATAARNAICSIPKVREGIKEIAQMDGAFVVNPDGTVEAAARYIDASAETITLSKGLGRATGPPPPSRAKPKPWPWRSANPMAPCASSTTAKSSCESSPSAAP